MMPSHEAIHEELRSTLDALLRYCQQCVWRDNPSTLPDQDRLEVRAINALCDADMADEHNHDPNPPTDGPSAADGFQGFSVSSGRLVEWAEDEGLPPSDEDPETGVRYGDLG